jgi:SPP1 gp7 family putative phage head morphogenesis protein
MEAPGKQAFAFRTSQEKITEFMSWLQQQVDKGILTVSEYRQLGTALQTEWTDLYIEDSYKRGIIRARYEMTKAGWAIPSIEASGGIMAILSAPWHIDRLGILFSRTFTDLKGVTAAMDSQMSRILAQGMADGDGPRLIARKLISTINGDTTGTLGIKDTLGRFIPAKRRAEMIARTEMQRAHHMAMIQEYRNWKIVGVNVMAEWITAGDSRVCSACFAMEGKIFTLDEIEPMIPLHPACRCIAISAGPEHDLPA